MANVLIVAYLLIVLALVAVILLQRSEGGGLGMGSSANGFMSVRGTANVLTRATGILAALFFATAIGLTLLNGADRSAQNILDRAAAPLPGTNKPGAAPSVLDALNAAQQQQEQQSGTAPAAGTTPSPATTPAPASQDAPDVALPAASANSTPAPATTTAPAPATTAPAAPAATTAPAAAPGTASANTSGSPAAPAPGSTTTPAAPASQ